MQNNTDYSSKLKSLYKLGSPSSWKENYKLRCAERLKTSRSKLLNHFRNLEADVGIDEVMNEEFQQMKKELCSSVSDMAEFDDVLRCMEEIKLELCELEMETMLKYENQMLNHDIDAAMAEDDVICPLCKLRNLKLTSNILHCDCGLQINTEQNSISLLDIKMSLEKAMLDHSSKCLKPLVFSVVNDFRSSHLLMACSECDYMFIVA